jgi:uncharacterized protein
MTPSDDSAAIKAEGLRGFLHRPQGAAIRGLVLTHGAGSNCTAPLLAVVARAFCAAGFAVLRCDLAFRQERPSGPPFPAKAAADRASLRTALAYLGTIVRGDLYLGGHSYGGRQASMLAAEAPELTHGLLLLSYPLHPPKKPQQLRTDHFAGLSTPCVFVHGTSDPFGTIAEIETAIALIPARTHLISIARAGHDLARGRFDAAPAIAALRA